MTTRILKNWNLMRLLRLAIGLAAFVQAVLLADIAFAVVAAMLAAMAIFNIGCCGPSGCTVDSGKPTRENKNRVIYEELDNRK